MTLKFLKLILNRILKRELIVLIVTDESVTNIHNEINGIFGIQNYPIMHADQNRTILKWNVRSKKDPQTIRHGIRKFHTDFPKSSIYVEEVSRLRRINPIIIGTVFLGLILSTIAISNYYHLISTGVVISINIGSIEEITGITTRELTLATITSTIGSILTVYFFRAIGKTKKFDVSS